MCKEQITIFLVDDDLEDQLLLSDAINHIAPAIQVKLFNNGSEVLHYLSQADEKFPCLIILDYNMPVLNGLQVLEKIRSNEKWTSIPRIVWSTSNSHHYKTECLGAGAIKYITKPQNLADLQLIASEIVNTCKSAA